MEKRGASLLHAKEQAGEMHVLGEFLPTHNLRGMKCAVENSH